MAACLVTGAGSGLGEALVEALDAAGKEVIGTGPGVDGGFELDVTVQESVDHAANTLPPVDSIINCAGINWLTPFEMLDIDAAKQISDVNVWGAVRVVQAFLPFLQARNGVVCNIVSTASHTPMTHSLAYNVSKAGMEIATRQMAHELRAITVFGVSPAKISGTRMSKYIDEQVTELRGWTPEKAREYQLSKLVTGREVNRDVLAAFVAYLMSDFDRCRPLSGCVLPYGA